MGKCASKDVVNGQIVPETELDAGSPMFAPEAPPAGGESATVNAGNEVTFKGYAPAPIDPVAAALPVDQTPAPRGHDVDFVAGAHYSGGYPSRTSAVTSHVKTEHVDPREVVVFQTLEQAEEAARKQNQAWGVDHLPYDPKSNDYGNTYASAFPPSSSVFQQTEPTDPRPVAQAPAAPAHQDPQARAYHDQARAAQPEYHHQQPRYSNAGAHPAEPLRSSGAFASSSPQQHAAAAAEYESPAAVPVAEALQQQPMESAPAVAEAPVAAPIEEPTPANAEEPTSSKKKKKKSKKSSKGKNWAWF